MSLKFMKRTGGFSLIEMLVAVGILGIIMAAMTTSLVTQAKQIKSLNQRAEALELKNLVIQTFGNQNICTWQVQGRVIDVATTTTTNPSPTVLSFSPLFQGLTPTSAALAVAGEKLPLSHHNLVVETITLSGFLATGIANEYQATWEISFDPLSTPQALKSSKVTQIIRVVAADPPSSKRIQNCGPPGASSGGVPVYRCPHDICDNNSASTCAGQLSFSSTCQCRADLNPIYVRNCPAVGTWPP